MYARILDPIEAFGPWGPDKADWGWLYLSRPAFREVGLGSISFGHLELYLTTL
jgi:hypothetical protein